MHIDDLDPQEIEVREKLREIATRARIEEPALGMLESWLFRFTASGSGIGYDRDKFPKDRSSFVWDLELRLPIFEMLERLSKSDSNADLEISVIASNKNAFVNPFEQFYWEETITRQKVRRMSEDALAEYAAHLTSCVLDVFYENSKHEFFIVGFERSQP